MNNLPVTHPTKLDHLSHTEWQALDVQPTGSFTVINLREFHLPGLPTEFFNTETGLWEILY